MIKNHLAIHTHDRCVSYLFIFMTDLLTKYSCVFTLFITHAEISTHDRILVSITKLWLCLLGSSWESSHRWLDGHRSSYAAPASNTATPVRTACALHDEHGTGPSMAIRSRFGVGAAEPWLRRTGWGTYDTSARENAAPCPCAGGGRYCSGNEARKCYDDSSLTGSSSRDSKCPIHLFGSSNSTFTSRLGERLLSA